MPTYSSETSIADQGRYMPISAVHPHIIQTHILTRLDGQTLASAGCASSELHALSTDEKLWTDICNSTWPSTTDPRIRDTISTFPSGHRSFFSDSFPTLDHRHRGNCHPSPPTSELLSAVDLHYGNKLVYSKVEVTEAESDWFLSSPFRVDLLDPKEIVATPVKFESEENTCLSNLENYMTLSWVVIDPTRKRAANLSCRLPVSVQRHWLTGEVQLRYSTILADNSPDGSSEFVLCSVLVVCGGKEGGELDVREVSLLMQDMDGKALSGKETLVILQDAMESGRRKKGKKGEERERYEEYSEMKRERRERKLRRERGLDMLCMITGITIFVAFWAFILLR